MGIEVLVGLSAEEEVVAIVVAVVVLELRTALLEVFGSVGRDVSDET